MPRPVFGDRQTASFLASAIDPLDVGDQQVLWFERDATDWVIAKQLDLVTFQQTELGRFTGEEIPDQFCSLQSGLFATVNQQNELVVIDLPHQRRTTLALPQTQSSTFHSWFLTWSDPPTRLIVTERTTRVVKGQERMLLFSYTKGELTQLSEWTTAAYQPHLASDAILSMANTSLLEVRRLSDGALIETQTLDKILNVAPGIGIHLGEPQAGLVPIYTPPGRNIIYDYARQRIVFECVMPLGRCSDLNQDAALFLDQRSVEVVRLSDQQTLQRFDFSQYVYEARFIGNGEQLMVLLPDESVHLFDSATGALLHVWRSRAWVLPTKVGLLAGFAVWSCAWVWLSLRSGWHPLVDTIVLHGLGVAGLMLPVLWYGNLVIGGAFEFLNFESLAACWLLLVSLWCVFGRVRWSLRILAPILVVAVALGLNVLAFHGHNNLIALSAVGVVGVALSFTMILGLTHRWGLRWIDGQNASHPQPATHLSLQIPLRDSFWLMATIAILVAVARFVPLQQFDFRSLNMLAIVCTSFAVAALGGAWSASVPRAWLTRIVCLLVVIAGSSALHPQLFQTGISWNDWLGGLRAFSPLAIVSFGSLLIFRVHGGRWVMPRIARQQRETTPGERNDFGNNVGELDSTRENR